MKVLFICYANVGRSQVAHAYFQTLSKHDCDSAGIAVNERLTAMKLGSKKLKDNPNQSSVRYIRRELDKDVGEKEKQQLIPENDYHSGSRRRHRGEGAMAKFLARM